MGKGKDGQGVYPHNSSGRFRFLLPDSTRAFDTIVFGSEEYVQFRRGEESGQEFLSTTGSRNHEK